MDINLPLLILIGIGLAIAGYALYERRQQTRCQQCGQLGGNKLISSEIITREPTTVAKRRMRGHIGQVNRERDNQRSDWITQEIPAQKLTIRQVYRCPHCGYEYISTKEQTTTDLSA